MRPDLFLYLGIFKVDLMFEINLIVHGWQLLPPVTFLQFSQLPEYHWFEFLDLVLTPMSVSYFLVCEDWEVGLYFFACG